MLVCSVLGVDRSLSSPPTGAGPGLPGGGGVGLGPCSFLLCLLGIASPGVTRSGL